MTAMQKKRYPGVRPFETADQDLFFGRDRDVQDLSVLIALEKLVVLFGKSGLGKSSLINAGLIPRLTKTTDIDETQLLPIVVRFGSYVQGVSLSPSDNLLARLGEKSSDMEASAFLQSLFQEPTLWYHFKRKSGDITRFLLIFDQFEEFFTYPLLQQEKFKMQLAELVFAELPQSVRKTVPGLNKDQRHFLAEPLEVKVLFVIRADRLSQLDSMKDHIPAILHKCFELKGLSEGQAREAIEEPARKQGGFDSPTFAYSPESLQLMLQKLSESKHQTQTLGIETFQLQILCEYLESEVIAGHIPQNLIEPAHFADKIDDIYEGYYQRLLDKLPKKTASAAQRLIEESLIFSDDKTGDSRRLSVDADVLIQRYIDEGVTQKTLHELENRFLLRREPNSMGGFSYEVCHDTLVGPILRLKAERIRHEKNQRLLAISSLIILIFSLVIGLIFYFVQLKNEAVTLRQKAEKSLQAVEEQRDSTKKAYSELERSIEIRDSLEKLATQLYDTNKITVQREKNRKFNDYVELAQLYFKNNKFTEAEMEYHKALLIAPTPQQLEEVRKQIKKCQKLK